MHPAAAGETVPLRVTDGPVPVRAPLLPEAVRSLAAFAGLGAGTLSFGISATLTASTGSAWTVTGALGAGAWGIALMVWAALSLRRGAPVWPALTLRVVPVAVLLHVAGVAHGIWWAGGSPRSLNGTALSAAALELILLSAVGWLTRRTAPAPGTATVSPSAAPFLITIFASALLVAAITAPGLAATDAGQHAVPHGEHSNPQISTPAGHHHH